MLKYFQIDEQGEDRDIEIIKKIQEEKKELEIKIKKFDQELDKLNHQLSEFSNEEREKREVLFKWQRKTQDEQFRLNKTNNIISEIRIDLARLETKKENLDQEIENEMDKNSIEEILASAEIQPSAPVEFDELQKLKHQLELIGGIDPELEKEYPLVKERYEFLNSQNTDLKKTLKSLDEIIEKLNQKIETKFRKSFSQINQEFNRYFKIIFNGGDAKIMLQNTPRPVEALDEDNPDGEKDESKTEIISGIEILATPPGKKIKSIEMLSGGERTLTALALLCSIISINQPPFVVLDEVDAALDQENSFRFTEILKELRKHTQFIVITHNQQTIEVSDFLYGVTMGNNGVSKLISLKLED
ncbi:AAA family ATPase [Patescibacteria group bacterium]|nr:AAA family ATPase [Patescibacteria group bacterium]